jgi:hypothetical protein
MNRAVRGQHSLFEEIKKRPLFDTEHFREGCFGCGGARIISELLNIGMTEHNAPPLFTPDERIGGTISAEHAVGICVEFCDPENRRAFNNGERAAGSLAPVTFGL